MTDLDTQIRAVVHGILPALVRSLVREELRAMLAPATPSPAEDDVAAFAATMNPGERSRAAELYQRFREWAAQRPATGPVSARAFGVRLMATGRVERRHERGGRVYVALGR